MRKGKCEWRGFKCLKGWRLLWQRDKLGSGLFTMELPDPLTNPPSLCQSEPMLLKLRRNWDALQTDSSNSMLHFFSTIMFNPQFFLLRPCAVCKDNLHWNWSNRISKQAYRLDMTDQLGGAIKSDDCLLYSYLRYHHFSQRPTFTLSP